MKENLKAARGKTDIVYKGAIFKDDSQFLRHSAERPGSDFKVSKEKKLSTLNSIPTANIVQKRRRNKDFCDIYNG